MVFVGAGPRMVANITRVFFLCLDRRSDRTDPQRFQARLHSCRGDKTYGEASLLCTALATMVYPSLFRCVGARRMKAAPAECEARAPPYARVQAVTVEPLIARMRMLSLRSEE